MDKKEKSTRVLIITSLIPTSEIKRKKDENNILFLTEDNLSKKYEVAFKYFFIFPRSFYLLSLISKKWKSYYRLQKKDIVNVEGREIDLIPQFLFRVKLPFRSLYYRFSLFLLRYKIDKLIKKIKPTIIHAHNIDNQAFIAKWIGEKYNIPYIVTVRSTKVIDKMVRQSILNAKAVISLSKNLINEQMKNLKCDIKIIPHALSEDYFYDIKVLKDRKIKKCLRLITVSRLLKYKNIDFVIKQLSEIKNRIDFEYTIYGNGPEYDKLKNLIRELELGDHIFLKGRVPHSEIKQHLYESDIFILLSYPETFGRVFIEALAAGTPFIGREHTGLYGLIENNKESIFCNEENFQQTLIKLYNNSSKVKDMQINARLAAERFTWDKIGATLMDTYLNSENAQF